MLQQLALGALRPPRTCYNRYQPATGRWPGAQVAAWAHWQVTGDDHVALTVIGGAVRRGLGQAVLRYLAHLGPAATDHAADLRALLNMPGPWSRVEAAHAFWRITGDPEPVIPVLLAAIQPLHQGRNNALIRTAVRYLGDIGSKAEDALPLLEWMLASERRFADQYTLQTIKDDEALIASARTACQRIEADG